MALAVHPSEGVLIQPEVSVITLARSIVRLFQLKMSWEGEMRPSNHSKATSYRPLFLLLTALKAELHNP